MADVVDLPVEVTLIDGTQWIIYYRNVKRYADALGYLHLDIVRGALIPAEDLDRLQRRHSHVNAAHIVSVREADRG